MSDGLMPCAHCGGDPMMIQTTTVGGVMRAMGWAVICKTCQATFLGTMQQDSAINLWNRRARPEGAATTGADVTAKLNDWAKMLVFLIYDTPAKEPRDILKGITDEMLALAAALKARTG